LTLKEEIDKIISNDKINGYHYWARYDGNIHAPAGYSTIDVLYALGDIGIEYREYDIIKKAIEFIFIYYDGKGQFRYSEKSSKLPCITARILAALGKLEYREDKRIYECYNYLLNTQEEDGGWRCSTVKKGKSISTDASNPGTTLYVLDAFRYRDNNKQEVEQLNRAITFLLNHWDTRTPLGPCEFGIGSTFMKIEYPFIRYNIFYYVYILSKYKKSINDRRYIEAKEILKKKTINGNLVIENPHKSWREYSFSKKNEISEIANKKYCEIINSR
jgi:hypothetical protein